MPYETNKSEILSLMDETRFMRQNWIQSSRDDPVLLTFNTILNTFPKFKEYSRELVNFFLFSNNNY